MQSQIDKQQAKYKKDKQLFQNKINQPKLDFEHEKKRLTIQIDKLKHDVDLNQDKGRLLYDVN